MGIFSDGLKQQIASNKSKINQYEADLGRYQQAVKDARTAKDMFEKSASNMDSMVQETAGVFQGSAATKFVSNLMTYNKTIWTMVDVMEKKIKSFEKRISEIEGQKAWCNAWNAVLTGLMETLKAIGF